MKYTLITPKISANRTFFDLKHFVGLAIRLYFSRNYFFANLS